MTNVLYSWFLGKNLTFDLLHINMNIFSENWFCILEYEFNSSKLASRYLNWYVFN